MRGLLAVVLANAVSISTPMPLQVPPSKSPVVVDAKGDVVRFYGVPMSLKQSDLKRYRYKVGHFSGEGDTYTFYTLKAQDGVELDIQFHEGKLISVRTSSARAVSPRGVGVGSLLSEVRAVWPAGRLVYGVEENQAFVTFVTGTNVMYFFDPKDMPPGTFLKPGSIKAIPDIKVQGISISDGPNPVPDACVPGYCL